MKKIILSLLVSAFLFTLSHTAQASVTADKPTFFSNARKELNKNGQYTTFKANTKLDKRSFRQIEETVLSFYYYDTRSRMAYFDHMMSCSVDQGVYSQDEANQIKQILRAAVMKKEKIAAQLINGLASSATTKGGKHFAAQMKKVMTQIQNSHDGRQAIDGLFGAIGRLVGAIVGTVAGAITGGLAGALGGAIAGHKLGGILGDALDNVIDEAGGGNGVWAGPNGDRDCTPPFNY